MHVVDFLWHAVDYRITRVMELVEFIIISQSLLVRVAVSTPLYTLYGIFYRLFLFLISLFPGPKVAAVSVLYECYYDIIIRGSYI
jgi:hypothetical protein